MGARAKAVERLESALGEAAGAEVVVERPGEADRRPFTEQRGAFVRPRPVADDIAEAPELVEPAGVDLCEHGLERGQVRMDVGENRYPQKN